MPKAHSPRHGSMQFWPRKRAKSEVARVRLWANQKDANLIGFAGYKVSMAHVMFEDTRDRSPSKGKTVSWPVTIIECPPLTAFSIKFYKNNDSVSQVFAEKFDKNLQRKCKIPKNKSVNDVKEEDFDDLKLIVHTNPGLTTVGKKKPEIFEMALGGKKEEKLNAAKELLGKEIQLKDVFNTGQIVDIHAITKGKGFQGPVKRFGIGIRRHKSEKTKRGPGSLGGWKGHAHFMYRIAHAGQMGYHQRTEYNKQILKIGDKEEGINPKSGFKHYGIIKNNYIIFKGSIAGPVKRLIRFNHAIRPNKMKEVELNIKLVQ
ncbi:50S ribosomal protein L3 [Candidatus Woesearchaeota archaeon B3_Woes]|nr:MAG: 50S ribosomal protein L3 [Candidatus Woesearchaeota archaeon B3_Woes]